MLLMTTLSIFVDCIRGRSSVRLCPEQLDVLAPIIVAPLHMDRGWVGGSYKYMNVLQFKKKNIFRFLPIKFASSYLYTKNETASQQGKISFITCIIHNLYHSFSILSYVWKASTACRAMMDT
ncbi:hypothetical protein C8F04DRAFT_316726 [Mycena alexandri]|uniref:Uncharacterized protein n=1 Tax=Mycena alexandri TaxID=1745969 RepID=A0AAD6T793_9AGAR|nr:hypothetical protein C8F04DRAFT_316726 [Mycena alexandri]